MKVLDEKMKSIEVIILESIDIIELQNLQGKVKEKESKIKELIENRREDLGIYYRQTDKPDRRTVEEGYSKVIEGKQ